MTERVYSTPQDQVKSTLMGPKFRLRKEEKTARKTSKKAKIMLANSMVGCYY